MMLGREINGMDFSYLLRKCPFLPFFEPRLGDKVG
jgi:hypothetical protein